RGARRAGVSRDAADGEAACIEESDEIARAGVAGGKGADRVGRGVEGDIAVRYNREAARADRAAGLRNARARIDAHRSCACADGRSQVHRAGLADEVDVAVIALHARGTGRTDVGSDGADGKAGAVQEHDVTAGRASAGVSGEGADDLIRRSGEAQVNIALCDHGKVGGTDDAGGSLRYAGTRVEPYRRRAAGAGIDRLGE